MKSLNSFSALERYERYRRQAMEPIKQYQELQHKQEKLEASIESYKSFNLKAERDKIEFIERRSNEVTRTVRDLKNDKEIFEENLKNIQELQSWPILLWKFVDSDQKKLYNKVKHLRQKIVGINNELSSKNKELSKNQSEIDTKNKRIVEYECFDLKSTETQLAIIKK